MLFKSNEKIEKYYLRVAGTAKFLKKDVTEKDNFYIFKTNLDSPGNNIKNDYAVEFAQKGTTAISRNDLQAVNEKIIDWRSGKINYANIRRINRQKKFEIVKKQKRMLQEEQFLRDEEGCLKDIFLIKEKIWKNKVEITLFEIDRKKFTSGSCKDGLQKIPYLENKYVFDFNNGKFSYKKESSDILEVLFPEEIEKDVVNVRNGWAGRELTDVCSAKGMVFMKAICQYPYEPNFSLIKAQCSESGLDLGDRCNPNGFNEFCSRYKIQNCKTLRKLYTENPAMLIYFYSVLKCGFKDVNIIFKMIKSEQFQLLFENTNTSFLFFMKYALKYRSEKSVWNLFLNIKSYQEANDIMHMFLEYSEYLPSEIKNRLVYEGFTKYNHDVLAKNITHLNEKKIEFKYTMSQLELEDEVMGYKFKLPENTQKLKELGDEMNNCVAGYRGRILAQSSTIVYAEKDSKKRICIEIRNNHVIQSFAPGNHLLAGIEKKVLNQWKEKKNLV